VRNIGEGNATGVVVQDVLPDDVTFVSADPTQGTYDPETGIWEVGDLASGAMAMMLIEVDVGGGGGDALKSAALSERRVGLRAQARRALVGCLPPWWQPRPTSSARHSVDRY
jgi:hypothetical protein